MFGIKLYVFRTVPLSTIGSFSLYTQLAVSKPVWHILLLCVQWKTPYNGHRNCPKYVEFYSKNKFEKLLHLFGFIIWITVESRRKCLLLYLGHPCAGQCSCSAVYSANYTKSSLNQLPHAGFKQHLTTRSIPSITTNVAWSTRHKRTSPLNLRALSIKWDTAM